eukprot:gene11081-3787_t
MSEKQKLLELVNYPKIYAASTFHMSVSDFTKLCKLHGIERWPYHSNNYNQEINYVPFKSFKLTPNKPQPISKSGKCKNTKPDASQQKDFIESQIQVFQKDTMKTLKRQKSSTETVKPKQMKHVHKIITTEKPMTSKECNITLPSFGEFLKSVETNRQFDEENAKKYLC